MKRIRLLSLLLLVMTAGIPHADPVPSPDVAFEFGPKKLKVELSFVFITTEEDHPALDRILVRLPARKQILRIDFVFGHSVNMEMLREGTRLEDLNGDGFEDLLVPAYSSPTGNRGFWVWVYSPETTEFVYCTELQDESNIEVSEPKIVHTMMSSGMNRVSNSFRWDGQRFELISVYEFKERDGGFFEKQRSKVGGKWREDFDRKADVR